MAAHSRLEARVREHLRTLEGQGLRRVLQAPTGVDLSSNDYLGLSQHPRVRARMIEAIGENGCGSTGSRLLRGHRELFDRVEQAFAAFKGTERSLYFSSGYLANLAVLTTFVGRHDLVVADRASHASLRDGVRLARARHVVLPHADARALARVLDARPPGSGQAFVVTESLFSMDGDEAPLDEYADVCRNRGAHLVVDEAHAVGLYGTHGSGLIEARGVAPDVFLSIDTAGKALGVAGAFVSGPAWAIEYLVHRARPFVFSTAPPPAAAAAIEASLAVLAEEPWRRALVRTRAAWLRRQLAGAGVPVCAGSSAIVPIVLGDAHAATAAAEALSRHGFDVRAIRPPTVPAGTARLRVTVNATVPDEALARFVEVVAACCDPAATRRAAGEGREPPVPGAGLP
jgi:8-amino-7-oxononanoate synthase